MKSFYFIKITALSVSSLCIVSCSNITKEDAVQTAGAVGGGALGYSLGDSDSERALYGAGGALIGGLGASQLAGNQDFKKGVEKGKEDGYLEGQADAAKRLYWVLQAAQGRDRAHGTISMREVEIAPTRTDDGRYLMARKVTIPVVDAPN